MTPIQEFRITFENGDIGDARITDLRPQFSSEIALHTADGNIFPAAKSSPPVLTAQLAFDALVSSAMDLAKSRGTEIASLDNPNNCELIDRESQRQIARKYVLTAPILVNGA